MENLGYSKKLCILPFDHRSYFEHLFGYTEPLTQDQKDELTKYKEIIYAGYELSLSDGVSKEDSAVLVDDVFGLEVLLNAKSKGYTTLQSTEISGIDYFEFEHGKEWQSWIDKVKPTFTKVLLRYNVSGDRELNNKSLVNLKLLSDYSHAKGYKFLIELLVPPTDSQMLIVNKDKIRFDHELRPELTVQSIEEIQDAGIEPDVWKIEGMYVKEDYEKVVHISTRDGRSNVGIVSLGRNETDEVVERWLKIGASVKRVIGFAVGRTVFLDALLKHKSGEYSREQASEEVSRRFLHFYNIFNKA
ncbi:MAG: DUF2090 domain-containing protein [Candidatus Zambryskibacteria bacterium]|nr:DUF2090 domain-containing protein [Candidatus Zambryskibacteria bacterium]